MKEPAFNPETSWRVLVVEDERRLREMLLRAIPDMGFTPVGAASGEEAMRLMEAEPFGMAILDLNLPGIGGLELFQEINKRWPRTQVVILTGFGDLDAAKKAIRMNVVDFLTKPCMLGDLEVALDRARQRTGQSQHSHQGKPALAMPPPEAPDEEGLSSAKTLQDHESTLILAALDRNNGNRTATAAELGISVRTLYYRLAEYERKGLISY
jgi:DNA-binding NtrC family response regulator